MEYEKLRDKVKSLGLRVTKDVKGKRVKLTKGELKAKLPKKSVAAPSLENQAKSAKKFIRVCKMVLREAEPRERRVVMAAPVRAAPSAPMAPVRAAPSAPMAPPPPPRPQKLNARAALMANLKANLKRRGLANN